MYVGVDIGGTKTLVATLDNNGVITEQRKFPTAAEYGVFLDEFSRVIGSMAAKDFISATVAAPGKIDREAGVCLYFGNLKWKHTPLQADVERIVKCPVLLENDANLAGLSESMLLPKDKKILYVTISTGIGDGFIANREIVPELADSEGGQMVLEFHGKPTKWEEFASGKAIVKRFGKKAADISDEETWRRIAHDLSLGFIELLAIGQPDVVVIGGSVGSYFERYKDFLLGELNKHKNPLVPIPEFRRAARPEEAVVYGCYDLARMHYGINP